MVATRLFTAAYGTAGSAELPGGAGGSSTKAHASCCIRANPTVARPLRFQST